MFPCRVFSRSKILLNRLSDRAIHTYLCHWIILPSIIPRILLHWLDEAYQFHQICPSQTLLYTKSLQIFCTYRSHFLLHCRTILRTQKFLSIFPFHIRKARLFATSRHKSIPWYRYKVSRVLQPAHQPLILRSKCLDWWSFFLSRLVFRRRSSQKRWSYQESTSFLDHVACCSYTILHRMFLHYPMEVACQANLFHILSYIWILLIFFARILR